MPWPLRFALPLLSALFLVAPSGFHAAHAATPATRQEAVSLYQTMYVGSGEVSPEWTGSTASCDAGDVSAAYRDAGLQRLVYFRAMAGLPANLTMDSTWNAQCQEAALMMSANHALSHSPDASWSCYSSAGAAAAGKSNLAAGYPSLRDAVTGWMRDQGVPSLGHRRWILYPPLATVGIGAAFGSSYPAYALWVIGGGGSRPLEPAFVAWPPPTWVPYALLFPIWSFSVQGADFSATTVQVRLGQTNLPVTLQTTPNGYGDNTLTWTVQGITSGPPAVDTVLHVEVRNVSAGGESRDYTYDVTLIDPAASTSVVSKTWSQIKELYRASRAKPGEESASPGTAVLHAHD
jgi:uncharacterized protein YkwD